MADGDRLCHGDFHPGNILVAAQGEMIIDRMDASQGNPLADVARTAVILQGVTKTEQLSNRQLRLLAAIFYPVYLRTYFRLRPDGRDEYAYWVPIVAAARLSEGIQELEVRGVVSD